MKKIYRPMGALDSTDIGISETNGEKKVDINSKYFGREGFWGEYKFDGSRYILQWDEEGKVYLTSRNVSVRTSEPVDKTENLRGYCYDDNKAMAGCVIDGEIIAKDFLKGNGSALVNKVMLSVPEKAKQVLKEIEVYYVVYDCLRHFNVDVQMRPLEERRQFLQNVVNKLQNKRVIMSPLIMHDKETFLKLVSKGYEGMMIKDKNSVYEQDKHSKHWQKVKKIMSFDGIVMGCTLGTGKYKGTLGALIIGQYFGDTVKEVCTVSGMTDSERKDFFEVIKLIPHSIDTDRIVFNDVPAANWVVEFTAQEKTASRYRHPRFIQNRHDKPLKQCIF